MKCYEVVLRIFIEADNRSDAIEQVLELSASDLDIEYVEEC